MPKKICSRIFSILSVLSVFAILFITAQIQSSETQEQAKEWVGHEETATGTGNGRSGLTPEQEEIIDYMYRLYQALEDGDDQTYAAMMEGLPALSQSAPSRLVSAGMERISVWRCGIWPLDQEGKRWYVFAESAMKIAGMEETIPEVSSFIIARDNKNRWQAMRDEEGYLLSGLSEEQVKVMSDISAEVERAYQECLVRNEAVILAFIRGIKELANVQMAKLAEQITVDSYVPESEGDLWAFLEKVTDRFKRHPLLTEQPDSGESIKLFKSQIYQVEKGDSLYAIAEKLWQDGNSYPLLMTQNPFLADNPDLIYPDTKLSIGQKYYLLKNGSSSNIMRRCWINYSSHWREESNQYGSFVLSDAENYGSTQIFGMVGEKTKASDKLFADWEGTTLKIKEYAKRQFGGAVNNLVFEQYQLADGELYVYSCLMSRDSKTAETDAETSFLLTVAVKRTASLQVEFIGFSGFSDNFDLRGETRYIAASFRELGKKRQRKIVDEDIPQIYPVFEWELNGLFNPFDWFYNLQDIGE